MHAIPSTSLQNPSISTGLDPERISRAGFQQCVLVWCICRNVQAGTPVVCGPRMTNTPSWKGAGAYPPPQPCRSKQHGLSLMKLHSIFVANQSCVFNQHVEVSIPKARASCSTSLHQLMVSKHASPSFEVLIYHFRRPRIMQISPPLPEISHSYALSC